LLAFAHRGKALTDKPKDEPKKRPLLLSLLMATAGSVLALTIWVIVVSLAVHTADSPAPSGPKDYGSILDTVFFRRTEDVLKWWLWTMKWILPFCIAGCIWHRIKEGTDLWDSSDNMGPEEDNKE
jgi:hypothetical protein